MNKVSIVGYGRFGAALASLFHEAGISVRAFDPGAFVPDEICADSIPSLVRGAELILVAVPVPRMRAVFEELRPHLSPTQIVADLGSVKAIPAAAMAATFDDEIPWVATHPLFGPRSLAQGERPLRVVVCPNALHPEAVRRVTALFEQIDCQVIAQDPEAHDRAMAFTHALTFFIAKGLLDTGAPLDAKIAPPSFQALARMVETVRSDAGHLFTALHSENLHAPDARRRLLHALHDIDQRLLRESKDTLELASLAIPELGERSSELRETREHIDDIDRKILDLLAQRVTLAKRAARAKARLGHGICDPGREARLFEARRAWAKDMGLDAEPIAEIFETIVRFCRSVQVDESDNER